MDQKTLAELKVDLYRALLLKEPDSLTDSEIDIAFHLARDDDIQNKLKKGLSNGK